MISEELVNLSRLQFAVTALYDFLFVPLTIGMVWLLHIMESVYVCDARQGHGRLHEGKRTCRLLMSINPLFLGEFHDRYPRHV